MTGNGAGPLSRPGVGGFRLFLLLSFHPLLPRKHDAIVWCAAKPSGGADSIAWGLDLARSPAGGIFSPPRVTLAFVAFLGEGPADLPAFNVAAVRMAGGPPRDAFSIFPSPWGLHPPRCILPWAGFLRPPRFFWGPR